MNTHFFSDMRVMLVRTMRHITRSLDTIITTPHRGFPDSQTILPRWLVGRDPHPSAAMMDAQSVKTVEESARISGFDAHKCVKGLEQHVLVDTLGLPLMVYVTPADMHDTQGARRLLAGLKYARSTAQENLGRYRQFCGSSLPPPARLCHTVMETAKQSAGRRVHCHTRHRKHRWASANRAAIRWVREVRARASPAFFGDYVCWSKGGIYDGDTLGNPHPLPGLDWPSSGSRYPPPAH
jgi:hypothetical protein